MTKNIVRPSILPGFMELLPEEQVLFNKMKDTIRKNYEKFGFLPIDTPVIEKSEILLAKGGGETEKQIYKVEKGSADMSLRFDLTVPLSRYVAQHYSELNFPFRRYQIAKVYRGERNQKGRYREFYQCDIDIVGNGDISIINDAEIPSVIYSTFKDLGFEDFTIRINNRRILKGFFNHLGIEDPTLVLRTIDKLEKIGMDKVEEELRGQGLDDEKIQAVKNFISIKGENHEVIKSLHQLNIDDELYQLGLKELEEVDEYIEIFGVPRKNYKIDVTIARGLDYYTGTIYETFLDDYPSIGSVCSGGRYDDLASNYTKNRLPGVGISIGLTRLFSQLLEAEIIRVQDESLIKVLIIPMDEWTRESIKLSRALRDEGIGSQVYFEKAKLGRKFNYGDKLNIPYVIVVGEEEVKSGKYSLRNMETGNQDKLGLEEIVEILKK